MLLLDLTEVDTDSVENRDRPKTQDSRVNTSQEMESGE